MRGKRIVRTEVGRADLEEFGLGRGGREIMTEYSVLCTDSEYGEHQSRLGRYADVLKMISEEPQR